MAIKRPIPKSVPGVRPTTGKVLESMLAILAPNIEDARAVDLFAGTGQVGLRLLEHGAAHVVFVEGDAKVAVPLRRRLKESPYADVCGLVVGRLPRVLERLEGKFQILLADPPYDWDEPATLLPALASKAEEEAILVVEHHHKTPYEDAAGWTLYRQQKYGETRLSFFRYEPG